MTILRILPESFSLEDILLKILLSFPNDYDIIFSPLKNLNLEYSDSVICLISQCSIYLIYTEKFNNNDDLINYIKNYEQRLVEFLIENNIYEVIPINSIYLSKDNLVLKDIKVLNVFDLKRYILEKDKEFNKIKNKDRLLQVLKAYHELPKIKNFQTLKKINSYYLAYDTLEKEIVILIDADNKIIGNIDKILQVEHNNILKVKNLVQSDNKTFIVQEYIYNSITLKDYINRQELRKIPQNIINIIMQLCDAIDYLHSKDIVYKYIVPEDIIITKEIEVKISPIQLLKSFNKNSKFLKNNPYIAPEILMISNDNTTINRQADVYSIGVILYELLTGTVPQYFTEKDILLSKLNNENFKIFEDIIIKALKFDPNERFSTVNAIKQRLVNLNKVNNLNSSLNRYINRSIYKKTKQEILYNAYDNKLEKYVLLKRIILNNFSYQDRKYKIDNLYKEICFLSQLNHPNILPIIDYFIEDDDIYIVLDMVKLPTLREYINQTSNISLKQIVNIIEQIAQALNYLHSKSIVHKNICPENIIFENNKVFLINLGINSILEQKQNTKDLRNLFYAAPEAYNNEQLDELTDIFSLGIVMYELLTKEYPYSLDFLIDKININYSIKIDNIPENLSKIVLKAIAINRLNRYQNINEFLSDLKKIKIQELSENKLNQIILNEKKISFLEIFFSIILITIIITISQQYISPKIIYKDNTLVKTNNFTHNDIVFSTYLKLKQNKTLINLKITNNSNEYLTLFNPINYPNTIFITDNLGNDYSEHIDLSTLDTTLFIIPPKSTVNGTITVNFPILLKKTNINLILLEYKNKNRKFKINISRSE